jgi:hypothetical protein
MVVGLMIVNGCDVDDGDARDGWWWWWLVVVMVVGADGCWC